MVKVGCKACRISKVKCDLAHCASRVCTRCARLGLACIENPPSRQGRPRIPDTTKRLSPAVRALLIKPPRRDADASGDALQPHEANGAQAVGVSPAVPQPGVQPGALTPFAWAPADGGGGELVSAGDRTVSGICSTWELFCRQMADVASKPLKLEIVRRAFAIARQAQNWGARRARERAAAGARAPTLNGAPRPTRPVVAPSVAWRACRARQPSRAR